MNSAHSDASAPSSPHITFFKVLILAYHVFTSSYVRGCGSRRATAERWGLERQIHGGLLLERPRLSPSVGRSRALPAKAAEVGLVNGAKTVGGEISIPVLPHPQDPAAHSLLTIICAGLPASS